DLMFANFWMYRTIRVNTPRPWGVKVSNSHRIEFRNMRSWTQVLQLPERTIFDMDKNLIVYPGDFARVTITGKEKSDSNENPNRALAMSLLPVPFLIVREMYTSVIISRSVYTVGLLKPTQFPSMLITLTSLFRWPLIRRII
ncbi:MAG: hypothetical protein ABR597_11025, partial [Bacteroidales bacterium]